MSNLVTLSITLSSPREGWQVFADAAALAAGAVWPSAVGDAIKGGGSLQDAFRAGYAACDADDGAFACAVPVPAEHAQDWTQPRPRVSAPTGTAWMFGGGRSTASISADGRTVTVSGPLDSSVGYRANAHPELARQVREIEAHNEAQRLLAEARARRPLAGRDCRELVRM